MFSFPGERITVLFTFSKEPLSSPLGRRTYQLFLSSYPRLLISIECMTLYHLVFMVHQNYESYYLNKAYIISYCLQLVQYILLFFFLTSRGPTGHRRCYNRRKFVTRLPIIEVNPIDNFEWGTTSGGYLPGLWRPRQKPPEVASHSILSMGLTSILS